MKRNITMAREMGLLHHPRRPCSIDIEQVDRFQPGQVLVPLHGVPG